jgi:hypothetical protein
MDTMDLQSDDIPTSDAHDLIWALLDEHISESELARLEEMLRSDESVRQLYVQCVQMHVDLHEWFAGNESRKPGSPGITLDMPMPSEGPSVSDGAF